MQSVRILPVAKCLFQGLAGGSGSALAEGAGWEWKMSRRMRFWLVVQVWRREVRLKLLRKDEFNPLDKLVRFEKKVDSAELRTARDRFLWTFL